MYVSEHTFLRCHPYRFVTLTQVSSEESIDMARLLAREEGLLVSASHFTSSEFHVKPKMSWFNFILTMKKMQFLDRGGYHICLLLCTVGGNLIWSSSCRSNQTCKEARKCWEAYSGKFYQKAKEVCFSLVLSKTQKQN